MQTVGFLNKLLEELEKTRRERQQLLDRNKQLEEDLRFFTITAMKI